ncbi:hypothetical protein [Vibrio cholerae]|uniref:hypothetical protein n=1 Tax=Vibrio cholerae TaxID=666 RepID=UPI00301A3362
MKIRDIERYCSNVEARADVAKPNLNIRAIKHTSKRFSFDFLKSSKSHNDRCFEQHVNEYQMIEKASIYGRRDISKQLSHVNIRTTPAAFSPTPNEIGVQIVTRLGSRSACCREGIILIKGSSLQAAIAVNREKKEFVLVLNRSQKATSIKYWLNRETKSQIDYLYASNIAQELVKIRNSQYNNYMVTITGGHKEIKLIDYVLDSASDVMV